ncbi:MAG: hypothetical protein CVV21_11805 [Candidatus Goldiibacteriota bacterium HGW-Goldbacteria-1]|jgi:predicted DNA-binding protein with PD1-like motif|nr:MAG: hypothetical protein CVV21_11805 [Candidatus Goldiibacteriota bacterium HGW-Goldbacteria-1]
MKYAQAKQGRTYLVKFENNDDFIEEVKSFIKKEKIKCAFFVFLGAVVKAKMAAGPKKAVIPPVANMISINDGWEVFGTGSVFLNKKGEPQVHIHGNFGKGEKSKMGCVRADAKIFNVIEAMVTEITGVKVFKDIDTATGLNMMQIK